MELVFNKAFHLKLVILEEAPLKIKAITDTLLLKMDMVLR
jgi:hypothetical protein